MLMNILQKNYCLSIIDQLQLLLAVNQKKLRKKKSAVKKETKKLKNILWEKKWEKK